LNVFYEVPITLITNKNQKTMSISYEEGLAIAQKYGMEEEYNMGIESGDTPLQALMEWDLY
jgi:hypothetical protein